MTVREMLRRMDARELSEWIAWYNLEAEEEDQARSKAELKARMRR